MQNEHEIHLLADEFEKSTVPVGAWKRFANYIVDQVFISICTIAIDYLINLYQDYPMDQIAEFFFNYLIYLLLMFAMEASMKGKSIGKLITKTRAVNEIDGSFITARTAFLRSLCRLVPFEPFSALGSPSYPWHDKWTGTTVVED